jgi:hypothetical protein
MGSCDAVIPVATGFLAHFLAASGMPTLAAASVALYVAYRPEKEHGKQD